MQKDLVVTGGSGEQGFKDHFSRQADGYARYRPTYPPELFRYLTSLADSPSVCWDCATGNGQAAIALAEHFGQVIASDASEAQIAQAAAHPGVSYRVATAERSGLDSGSVELVTVGQAFHWFDAAAFFREAKRVLRPKGVLALWCYGVCEVSEECDAVIDRLYSGIVGDFWPPERAMIEQGYAGVELPGMPIAAPSFDMSLDWTAADMLGYLRTWSAVKHYEAAHGSDPVAEIEASLHEAWGASRRRVSWPLKLKISRPNTLLE